MHVFRLGTTCEPILAMLQVSEVKLQCCTLQACSSSNCILLALRRSKAWAVELLLASAAFVGHTAAACGYVMHFDFAFGSNTWAWYKIIVI